MCAHCPRDCPFTFKDVEDRSWVCFSYFMNYKLQTDLPLKMIHVSLIHVTKCNATDKSLFCLNFRSVCLKNDKSATFVFRSFQLKP